MIKIYTAGTAIKGRKTMEWFKKRSIPFQQRIINKYHPMTANEINEILKRTEKGFEDIISYRSARYKQLPFDIEECTVKETIDLLIRYPELLRTPIVIEGDKLVVGYSYDEFRCFLPDKYRVQKLRQYYLSLTNVHTIFEETDKL